MAINLEDADGTGSKSEDGGATGSKFDDEVQLAVNLKMRCNWQ